MPHTNEELRREWNTDWEMMQKSNQYSTNDIANYWLQKIAEREQAVREKIKKIETWRCTDMGNNNDNYVVIRKDALNLFNQ